MVGDIVAIAVTYKKHPRQINEWRWLLPNVSQNSGREVATVLCFHRSFCSRWKVEEVCLRSHLSFNVSHVDTHVQLPRLIYKPPDSIALMSQLTPPHRELHRRCSGRHRLPRRHSAAIITQLTLTVDRKQEKERKEKEKHGRQQQPTTRYSETDAESQPDSCDESMRSMQSVGQEYPI